MYKVGLLFFLLFFIVDQPSFAATVIIVLRSHFSFCFLLFFSHAGILEYGQP
jgi:hypothetical protein